MSEKYRECMKKNILRKKIYSKFFFSDPINHFSSKGMILSTHESYLYSSENIPELTALLE